MSACLSSAEGSQEAAAVGEGSLLFSSQPVARSAAPAAAREARLRKSRREEGAGAVGCLGWVTRASFAKGCAYVGGFSARRTKLG